MKSWHLAIIIVAIIAVIAGGALILKGSAGAAVATVNGVAIPQSEVDKQFELIRQQQKPIFEGPGGAEQEKRFRSSILDYLVTAELIRQEAKKQGIKISEKEIDAKLAQVKKIFPDGKRFEEAMRSQGLTIASLREQIRDRGLMDKMFAKLTGDLKITDKDLEEYYNSNKAQFAEAELQSWRQIVLKSKAAAVDVSAKLKAGADFAETAKAVSVDEQTKKRGGELGPLKVDDFPPEMAAALRKLGKGEISPAIKGPLGYYIFQLKEVRPARERSFEEVKSQIRQSLITEKQRAKFAVWVKKLKSRAEIK